MILRAFQSKEMEGFKVEMLGGLLEAVWPCQGDGFTQLTRNKVMGKKIVQQLGEEASQEM